MDILHAITVSEQLPANYETELSFGIHEAFPKARSLMQSNL